MMPHPFPIKVFLILSCIGEKVKGAQEDGKVEGGKAVPRIKTGPCSQTVDTKRGNQGFQNEEDFCGSCGDVRKAGCTP
jgi:hypothetical protein